MKNNHIVFTTINKPDVLLDIYKNVAKYGNLENTVCWVVGDFKTPFSCSKLCQRIDSLGLDTIYLDISTQDEWGKKFAKFYSRIPYNNETRRNIGYLSALENGCERLISIDDDNYPTEDNFIGGHSKTGCLWSGKLVQDSSGYYNVCEHLDTEPNRQFFPRGFPFELRGKKNNIKSIRANRETKIGATFGLWLKDPDVDATTLLNGKIESLNYKGPDYLILDQNTWSPINTQNTSVARDLIPAFLCIPMGFPVPGGRIERYGDIWGGYFLQSVLKDTSYHVCFGRPIVEHRRNPHNYLDDMRSEYWGMVLTDWLLLLLREEFRPNSNYIIDRVIELSEFIHQISNNKLPYWCPQEVKKFLQGTSKTIKLWADVCRQII